MCQGWELVYGFLIWCGVVTFECQVLEIVWNIKVLCVSSWKKLYCMVCTILLSQQQPIYSKNYSKFFWFQYCLCWLLFAYYVLYSIFTLVWQYIKNKRVLDLDQRCVNDIHKYVILWEMCLWCETNACFWDVFRIFWILCFILQERGRFLHFVWAIVEFVCRALRKTHRALKMRVNSWKKL